MFTFIKLNNNISTLLTLTFCNILTFFVLNSTFLVSNNNFLILNKTLLISNKNSLILNNIFFTFSTSLIKFFTSTFIDKLIIDSIIQEIWLFNALNVETKLQWTFNYYSKLWFVKNFSINFLINLIVLFNYNFVVIKIVLTLFVKVFSIDFYKLKIYKKTITNIQHKIN